MPKSKRKFVTAEQSQLRSHIIPTIPDLVAYCINLKERKEKRKWFQKQMDRRNIKFEFFTTTLHPTSPKRGCLESHLAVIKLALQRKQKHILIFEDDAKIIEPITPLPTPPADWKMLYLGGTVHDILATPDTVKEWIRMSTWTTHAYILNLEDPEFVKALLQMEDYTEEVDRFYMTNIHYNYYSYMVAPMRVIQREGISDIEGKEVNYNFMPDTLYGLRKPEHTLENGQYRMKLQTIEPHDLPNITVITPTYNRRDLFYIALKNMSDTIYPRHKIKWIIIDDSDDPTQDITDLLPKSDNITHIKLTDKHYTVAEKRNIGASKARTAIILHMDDDDYYPPESFLARTKLLLKYTDIGCVGSSKLGTYDIINNASSVSTDGPLTLSEASMAYRKEFWIRQKFNPETKKGEQYDFLANRFNEVMDMPFQFNLFAITHTTNITQKERSTEETHENQTNFIDDWDIDSQLFFFQLRDRLRQKLKSHPITSSE